MTRPWSRALARKRQSGQPSQTPAPAGRRQGVRLRLEAVEDRTVTSAVAVEPPPVAPAQEVAWVRPADPPLAAPPVTEAPPFQVPAADGKFAAAPPNPQNQPPAPAAGETPGTLTATEARAADATPNPTTNATATMAAPADRTLTEGEGGGDPAAKPARPGADGSKARRVGEPEGVSPSGTESGPGPRDRSAARPENPAAPGPAVAAPTPRAAADAVPARPVAPAGKAGGARAAARPDGADLAGPETNRAGRPAEVSVLRPDHRLAADPSDGTLLQRFVADRDQAAFAALVQRHGSLVMGVCRQVLGDWGAAQDAFQNTFLILARKAGLLDRNSPLGGWLYKVAYRLALRSRATTLRQRLTEQEAGTEWAARTAADQPGGDVEQQELRQVLREELQRLPEEYRAPLLLCYFDGRTHADAAREIGLPRGSMAKRIGEGLEHLRERLLVRGFML